MFSPEGFPLILSHSHTHTLSLTHTRTTKTTSHSHSSLTFALTYTHVLLIIINISLSHSHTHTHSLTYSTYTHLSLSRTHTLTSHTHLDLFQGDYSKLNTPWLPSLRPVSVSASALSMALSWPARKKSCLNSWTTNEVQRKCIKSTTTLRAQWPE